MPTLHGKTRDYKRELEEIDEAITLRNCFSKVFDSPAGGIVLEWILMKCCFQRETVNEREVGLRDFATELFNIVNNSNRIIIQQLLSKWSLQHKRYWEEQREQLIKIIKELD